MKKLFLALFIPFLLTACGANNADTPQATDVTTYKPAIAGTWVLKDYYDALETTKSPKDAYASLQGIVSMIIDTTDMQGDSILVSARWNHKESYLYNIYLRPGKAEHSLQTAHPYNDYGTDYFEVAYAISNGDTVLQMNRFDNSGKQKESKTYLRVTGPQGPDSEPYGVQYIANKVLFSGKYKATDENGKTMEVKLTDDGLSSGIGTHTLYYIYTDFSGDELTNLDEMAFDAFTKTQKPYIFEIKDNTILLYQALQNEERTQLIRGDLKYTLVKE